MARKYHNHTLQTNPLHREEERHSTNSPITLSSFFKQPSLSLSLFPNEMIAKLEMTLSTAQQNKDQMQKKKKTQTLGATIIINQQQHTHRSSAQSKLLGAKIHFTGQIITLDYAVVKTKKRLPRVEADLSNVSSWGTHQIITVMKQTKWL